MIGWTTFPRISTSNAMLNRIEQTDEADFYTMINRQNVCKTRFENHWPYILQATRNCGFVYKDGETRIYYFIRNSSDLVVVNCFGETPSC